MIPPEWLDQAVRRLEGQIERTPLTYDPELNLYLKWENRQRTGSFKIRGALNKILSLAHWEQQRGLVTASAGNHGQGVALAGQRVGAPVIVFASAHAVSTKLEAIRNLGAEIRLVNGGYEDAEREAQQYASEAGITWVSPYNDGQVIAGQATLALEIQDQLREMEGLPLARSVVVPVGGGGLIAGIGAGLERWDQAFRPLLIGAQSHASPFFHALFYRGTQSGVVERESLADGLAGAVEDGSMTIPLVQSSVNRFVLVSEELIASAIAGAWHRYGEKIEGSAAVALAAALTNAVTEKPAVVILSGGNIQSGKHQKICSAYASNLLQV